MNRQRLLTDIRSMGWSAPLRAGYEASKRVGGHRLVFQRIVPNRGEVPELVTPFSTPTGVPDAAAERTLAEAAEIVEGRIPIFGTSFDLGRTPSWHRVIDRFGDWPHQPWWTIDIRSDERPGDVKWAWEVGRHRHLVVLARAAYLQPNDERFRAVLNDHLESWIDQNPPEIGIHWYSNLEIALRALNWLQVLALAGEQIEVPVREAMARHLFHAGRHLVADLPYTLTAMRNNHLLGDSLGLVALGKAFSGSRRGRRWQRLGDRLLLGQLARHFNQDGSTIEDAVSYHRFVLDMLALRTLLGDAPAEVGRYLTSGGSFLARLGAREGSVPAYGDWDEGRALVVGGDPHDLAGITRLSAALTGSGAPTAWRAEHDEVAWYAPIGEPAPLEGAEVGGSAVGGGIGRAQRGPFTVWLKAGAGPSHGHADLLNTVIRHGDSWVVGDPGTGTYNGSAWVRDYFRSSVAHAVLRLDGEDQLVPDRTFRFVHSADGRVGVPVELADGVLMWGVHNAYRRLGGSPRVARVVVTSDDAVTVADWVEGSPRPYRLSVPLGPEVTWDDGVVRLNDGTELTLDLPSHAIAVHGSERPYDGWWSDTYGSTRPSTRLEVAGETDGPVAWGMRIGDGGAADTDDAELRLPGGSRITVDFTETAVHLLISEADRSFAGRLELP